MAIVCSLPNNSENEALRVVTQNSDRFLTAFNRIDHRLRDIIGAKDFMPFYRLVDQAKKKDLLSM